MEFIFLACALAVCAALGHQLYFHRVSRHLRFTGIGISVVFTALFFVFGFLFGFIACAFCAQNCSYSSGVCVLTVCLVVMWTAWYFIGKRLKRSAFFFSGIFCGMMTVEVLFESALVLKIGCKEENAYPVAVLLLGAILFGVFFLWLCRGVNGILFATGGRVVFYCAALPMLATAVVFCIICHSGLSPQGQRNIGVFYKEWLPIPFECFRWYRKAAERGCRDAYYPLGRCYEEGHGVRQDYAKAAHWYHKARKHAGKRDAYAASFRLRDLYFGGLGVPRDPKKAKEMIEGIP